MKHIRTTSKSLPLTALTVPQGFWDSFYLIMDVVIAVLSIFGVKA